MTSSRPYLIRALYEWILDNNCTPYVLVNVNRANVSVPDGLAEGGQMVLNVSPSAVKHLIMDNEAISFEARFSGIVHRPYVPIHAVLAIYAKETGQGMFFDEEPIEETDPTPPETPTPAKGKPALRVVK